MANSSQTIAIYNAVLQRDPTDSELAAFVAASSSTAGEAQQIDLLVNSTEAMTFVYPVVSLYQATFGRVPEPGGLNFWVDYFRDATTGDDAIEPFQALSVINAGFAAADEFEALYPGAFESGVADEAFLNAIYMNVLGREPDQAGFDAYLGAPIEAVLTAFAVSSETIARYDTAIDLFLTKAANGTQDYAGSLLDLNDDGVVDDQDGVATDGQTFTLTENSDTIPGLIGSKGTDDTSGDDVIVAGLSSSGGVFGATNTLGTGDVIDAGTGFDTLQVIDSGSALTPNLTSVERINVQSLTATGPFVGNGTLLNLINANGVEQVWNVNSTEDLTVIEINDDVVLGFQNTDTDIDATFDTGAILDGAIDVAVIGSGEEASTAGNTEFNPEGSVNLVVDTTANDVTAINVVASGAASRLNIDSVTSDDDITSFNVSGDADLYVNTDDVASELETFTSTSTGNVTAVIGGNTNDLTATFGVGDDRLIVSSAGLDGDDAFDFGAGEDTLEVHFGSAVNLTLPVTGTNDIVDGVNAAVGLEVFNIDRWQSTSDIVLDASAFTSVVSFAFNDTFDSDAFTQDDIDTDITVTEVVDENTFTFETNVVGATSSFSAALGETVLNLSLEGNLTGAAGTTTPMALDGEVALVATDFETVNIEVVGDQMIAGGAGAPGGVTAAAIVAEDDAMIMISGEGSLTIEGVDADGVTIDGSAVVDGSIDVVGSQGEDILIGSDGDDILQGDRATTTIGSGTAQQQVSTVTIAGTPQVGDTFTATINGTDYTYTVQMGDTTNDMIATGLAGVIMDANGDILPATASGAIVTLNGLADGTPFELESDATNGPANADSATFTVADQIFDAGDVYRVSIDGVDYDYTAAMDGETQADAVAAFVSAINSGTQATAVDNMDGTFDVTGSTPGDNLGFAASEVNDENTDTPTTLTFTIGDLDTAGEVLVINLNGVQYNETYD